MGPLKGVKIIEVGGIGPGPFCGMMLSDMGAEITRIERKGGLALSEPKFDLLTRNRKSVSMNLRKPEGVETLLRMLETGGCPSRKGFDPASWRNWASDPMSAWHETPGSFTAG